MKASCLCGNVAWSAGGPVDLVAHCHCSICRKFHGAAFVTFGAFPPESFRLERGEDVIGKFESSAGFFRGFCVQCGSQVPVGGEAKEAPFFLPLGSFDDVPGATPLAHIYAASNVPWLPITDALPRFDEMPPGYESASVPPKPRPKASSGRAAGSCLCMTVTWDFDPSGAAFRHCHCSRCRKARSAAHASNIVAEVGKVRFTSGEDRVVDYRLPNTARFAQAFCGVCGGKVPRLNRELGYAVIPAGCLDEDPGIRPTERIFCGSQASWLEVEDGLPQHREMSPPA
jgi:hypothetical protein